MTVLSLAVLPWLVGPVAGLAAWAARLEAAVAQAAASGAKLLMTAEYAAMDAFAGPAPDIAGELDRAALASAEVLAAARAIAQRHRIWLLAGSHPERRDGIVCNRAWLIAPDGRAAVQDKHVLTGFEKRAGLQPGQPPAVFDTPWGRIGIAICLDCELPTLVRAQVQAGAWLILVPACTESTHGSNRVHIAARARAMENQCYVAVAPTLGLAPNTAWVDRNVGRAMIYGPVDRGFAEDGVIAALQQDEAAILHAQLDPARLEAVRRNGAVHTHLDWPTAVPPCRVAAPA